MRKVTITLTHAMIDKGTINATAGRRAKLFNGTTDPFVGMALGGQVYIPGTVEGLAKATNLSLGIPVSKKEPRLWIHKLGSLKPIEGNRLEIETDGTTFTAKVIRGWEAIEDLLVIRAYLRINATRPKRSSHASKAEQGKIISELAAVVGWRRTEAAIKQRLGNIAAVDPLYAGNGLGHGGADLEFLAGAYLDDRAALERAITELVDALNTGVPIKALGVTAPANKSKLTATLGDDYVPEDETGPPIRHPGLADLDVDAIERGTKAHRALQNAVGAYLKSQKEKPTKPKKGEPRYDIGWRIGKDLGIVEVKSATPLNVERKMRLAVGQLLRYRWALDGRAHAAAIVIEVRPEDEWLDLCESIGIRVAWPGAFDRILTP